MQSVGDNAPIDWIKGILGTGSRVHNEVEPVLEDALYFLELTLDILESCEDNLLNVKEEETSSKMSKPFFSADRIKK